jgi:hypothetical protein
MWIQIADYEEPVPQTDPYGRNTWGENEISFSEQQSGRYTWDSKIGRWVEYLHGEVPANMPGGYGSQGRTNTAPVYPSGWRGIDLGPSIGIKLVPDYGPKGFTEPPGVAVEAPGPGSGSVAGRPNPTPPPSA